MKKLIEDVNKYIPGKLKREGMRFNWYIENKRIFKFEYPSKVSAWYFLKGILAVRKICRAYTERTNRFGTHR